MDTFPAALIDAMGGTTVVAKLMHAPVSTVNNMRTRRVTDSRLNHLRRIAIAEFPNLDVDTLATQHGVALLPMPGDSNPSPRSLDVGSQRSSASCVDA